MSNNNFTSFWQSPLWSDILSRTQQAENIWHTFQGNTVLIERRKIVGNSTGLYILWVEESSITQECLDDISQKVVRKADLFLQIEPLSYSIEKQREESKEKREGIDVICPLDKGGQGGLKNIDIGQWEWKRGCLLNWKAPFRRFIEPVTAIIPLSNATEEKIFQNFKEKWRYNIRVAEKRGVTTEWVSGDDICTFLSPRWKSYGTKTYAEVFFDLLEETTQRDKFSHNTLRYYQTFLRVLEAKNAGGLLIAVKENTLHAAGIFVYWGKHALYYYGASASSSDIRRDNGTYLVQWHAIREALRRGCVNYDFLGISSREWDKLAGVTTFKMQFSPEKVIIPPEKVIIFHPRLLKMFQWANKLRKILRFR